MTPYKNEKAVKMHNQWCFYSNSFNNRAKQFIVDETYKTPTKVGYIYEFNNNRMLMYEKYKNVCVEEPLENSSEFFKDFE